MSLERRLEKPIPSFGFFSLWSRRVFGVLVDHETEDPPTSDFR